MKPSGHVVAGKYQRIGRNQVENDAQREDMAVADVERWLRPVLGYEPALVGAGR